MHEVAPAADKNGSGRLLYAGFIRQIQIGS